MSGLSTWYSRYGGDSLWLRRGIVWFGYDEDRLGGGDWEPTTAILLFTIFWQWRRSLLRQMQCLIARAKGNCAHTGSRARKNKECVHALISCVCVLTSLPEDSEQEYSTSILFRIELLILSLSTQFHKIVLWPSPIVIPYSVTNIMNVCDVYFLMNFFYIFTYYYFCLYINFTWTIHIMSHI